MNTKMFAISALCATVAITASAAEIVSSDVVGYATRDVNQGFSVNTPTFVDTGSTSGTIDLQSIKVVDGLGSQQEQIQVLGANGRMTGVTYYWLTEDDVGTEGWYDDDWAPISGVTFDKGDGVVLYSKGSNAKLQVSGQVVAGVQNIPLHVGFNVAGNSTNADLDLQSIKIEGGLGSQQEQIQVLGANGRMTGVTYYWLTEDDVGTAGWYDDAWAPIEGVTVKAGEAFIIYAKAGATLVLPSQL